jgi:hypothetical protein
MGHYRFHGRLGNGKAAILADRAVVFAPDPVGASLLAMDVNDNGGFLNERDALESIASKLAPTGSIR